MQRAASRTQATWLCCLAHSSRYCVSAPLPYLLYRGEVGEVQMVETRTKIAKLDPVWGRIVTEAQQAVVDEPLLGGLVHSSVLHHPTIERALGYRISLKLASGEMSTRDVNYRCIQRILGTLLFSDLLRQRR